MVSMNHGRGRRLTRLVLAASLALALGFGPVSAAFADPGEPSSASCQGIEASFVAPPGSALEAPGGNAEIAQINQGLGIPAGQEFKRWAQAKLGTHEECDEVLLGL